MNNLYAAFRAPRAGAWFFLFALISPLTALFAMGVSPAAAQSVPIPHQVFDVATIKPSDANNPPPESVNVSPDRFQAVGMTLKELIKVAWNLNYGADDQVAGGPPWIASTRFDLDAKEDTELASEIAKLPAEKQGDEVRAMLRDLITQRFQLQLHHETRELSVYELVVAKGGPKLLPAADPSASSKPSDLAGERERPRRWIRFAGVGELEGYSADMETLVTVLGMQPEIDGRMVLDKTGLAGNYDFKLKWTPDISLSANQAATSPSPSLFTALQEELGLRLNSAKAPIDRIIIDHVSPPSAN